MIRDFMNGDTSVEAMLELWASRLRAARKRIVPLFTQKCFAGSACAFLCAGQGLGMSLGSGAITGSEHGDVAC